jgi:sugar lactone lactonase YvrE
MKPPIEPVTWTPPPRKRPAGATPLPPLRLYPLPTLGEDVAVDGQGRLIAGCEDGRVVRLDPQSRAEKVETLVQTGGRPIGIELDRDGSLIVCDAERGLLRVDPERKAIEVLVSSREHGLGICNNASIAGDGTIYFSDSSLRFRLADWRADLFEHSGTGRLFALHPSGRLELLLSGLQFANGVALAADESFVAVAETGAYRVTRYFLRPPRRGWTDLLAENLPGFPDNLASTREGHIWIAVANPRNAVLDALHRGPPLLRKLAWSLPDALQPRPERSVHVMAVDEEGKVVHDLYGKSADFHLVTGMREHEGTLYLASLEHAALASLTLPPRRAR